MKMQLLRGEHKQNVNRGHNNDRHIYFSPKGKFRTIEKREGKNFGGTDSHR